MWDVIDAWLDWYEGLGRLRKFCVLLAVMAIVMAGMFGLVAVMTRVF